METWFHLFFFLELVHQDILAATLTWPSLLGTGVSSDTFSIVALHSSTSQTTKTATSGINRICFSRIPTRISIITYFFKPVCKRNTEYYGKKPHNSCSHENWEYDAIKITQLGLYGAPAPRLLGLGWVWVFGVLRKPTQIMPASFGVGRFLSYCYTRISLSCALICLY